MSSSLVGDRGVAPTSPDDAASDYLVLLDGNASGTHADQPDMTDLPPLTYSRPQTLAQVLVALRRPGACIYAGGTDLLVSLQQRAGHTAWVRELVDIKDLREAGGIGEERGGLRIGALVTAKELAADARVRQHASALAQAAAATSAPLLRARGTIGGNVVTPHPAGDVTTALLALDAMVEVVGLRGGRRRVALARFLASSPGGRALLLALHVPQRNGSAFEKLAHRHVFARSILAVAVARYRGALRVAIGGVGPRPLAVRMREDALTGAALQHVLRRVTTPSGRTGARATVDRLPAGTPEHDLALALIQRATSRLA